MGAQRQPDQRGGCPKFLRRPVAWVLLAPLGLLAVVLATAGVGAAGRPGQVGAVVPHDLIAQEGGAIRVMRADGDRLWLGHGPRLVALDVSGPTSRVVGRSPVLGGSVRDLATESLAPNGAGGDPGIAWALVAGNRIVGVDLRDSAQPTPLGVTEVGTDTVAIGLVGDQLWAVAEWGDLVGFDVSDPRAPRLAGRLAGAVFGLGVRAVGAIPGHLVVATSGYGTPPTPVVHVFDMGDPSRPARVGSLPKPVPGDWLVTAASVDGRVAWLIGGYPVQLIAVDLRAPATPVILSRLNLADSDVYSASALLVAGGRAYVTGGDYGHNNFTVAMIDVTDPAAPRFLGSHFLPRSSDPTGGMAAAGGRFWYATRDGQLFALDASQPVAGLPVVGDTQTIGPARELSVQPGYGLLSLGEALLTLDLRRPDAPRPLATTLLHHYPGDAAVVGNTALVVCRGEMDVLGGELHILDVSDPGTPRPVGTLFRNINPETIVVSGTLGAMLADRGDGSYWNRQAVLLDLADPAAPSRLGMVEDRAGFQDVALAGRLLLAAGPESISLDPTLIKLVVADVTDPAAPRRLGEVKLAGPIPERAFVRLAPAGRYVYLAAFGRGADYASVAHQALHVVDLADPSRPVALAELPLAGQPAAIRYAHGWLFVATTAGLRVYDLSDPARPRDWGVLPSGSDPVLDVRVHDGRVYVTAGDGGLYVFYPRLPGWPPPNLPPTPTTSPPTATSSTPTALPATASPSPGTPTATPRPPTATTTATATDRPRWRLFLPYAGAD